ncbi:PREDICTED: uncharacterized protein LOC108615677 [Drosophila arizonae]|uniref:Uncharacterized protein LOC108615677 n=1 Tax=Drosophila arizonae TaxID=7263 RepID=A0ABM1PF45_DROAR|nr:PREDICTED: uncharacterized protein LOC108615677 [Drosophila arizonae]
MGCECTLECKIQFFCIWIIVTGFAAAIVLGLTIPYAKQEKDSEILWACVLFVVLAAIEVVGGFLMLAAFLKNIAWMFMTGLVLSSFYPYAAFGFVVPIVIHIIFTIYSCQYYKTMK